MRKLTIVLLAVGFVLAAGSAWGWLDPPSWDNFENANLGNIKGQTSGGGWGNWNQNSWNATDGTDGRNSVQVVEGGPSGKFVKATCVDSKEMNRNINEYFHTASSFSVWYDFTVLGSLNGDWNNYISQGLGNSVHFEFRSNYEIRHRGASVNTVLGYWDGREGYEDYNLLNQWKNVRVDIDVAGQTYDLYIGGTLLAADLPFRSYSQNLDHVRFYGGKCTSGNNYWGIDNVWVTVDNAPIPEPSSLLALATGFAGVAGVIVRRRR